MELPVEVGKTDNLFMTPQGHLVVVEVKLWRNPRSAPQGYPANPRGQPLHEDEPPSSNFTSSLASEGHTGMATGRVLFSRGLTPTPLRAGHGRDSTTRLRCILAVGPPFFVEAARVKMLDDGLFSAHVGGRLGCRQNTTTALTLRLKTNGGGVGQFSVRKGASSGDSALKPAASTFPRLDKRNSKD